MERVTEILKQGQYQPMPVEEQVAIIFAGVNGFLDDLPREKVGEFEADYLKFLRSNYADVLNTIKEGAKVEGDLEQKLINAINEFKSTFAV